MSGGEVALSQAGAPCEGLPGAVGDRCFLGMELRAWRTATGVEAGAGGEGRLVAPAAVACSAAAVQKVRALAAARGGDVRVRSPSQGAAALAALGGEAWIACLAGDSGVDDARRVNEAPLVEIDPEEREIPWFPLPDGPLRVADAWILPVGHWVQLLWANLYALGPYLWSELAGTGLAPLWRLPWAAVRAGSVRPEDVAARLVRAGEGARVHRSAVVEGVVLGAGARVGAGAVVRGAVLGPGAVVEELAVVEGVVMGAGARVQRQALAKFSVIEAGAAHAGIVQLGVVGRGAQVKMGATLMDMTFGKDVRVRVGGELVRAPQGMCGVCVGPEAVVGSGVRVAAGRVIPAGVAIAAPPESVLSRLDLPPGVTRAVVRGGALEPS